MTQPAQPITGVPPENPAHGVQQPPEPGGERAPSQPSASEIHPAPGEEYDPHDPKVTVETLEEQNRRLTAFLMARFPSYLNGESAIDNAMRLLTQMSAGGLTVERCTAEFCNQPLGHGNDHGWVTVGG